MNTQDLAKWVEETDAICSRYFGTKFANTTIHFILGEWSVNIDAPRVRARGDSLVDAMKEARAEVDAHVRGIDNLAKTLGLEAAE